MTEEQIADIVDTLKWYAEAGQTPRPTRSFFGRVLELIEELQSRIAAEHADHEATI